jgi:hypothetical protein
MRVVVRFAIAALVLALVCPPAASARGHQWGRHRSEHSHRRASLGEPRATLECGDWPTTGQAWVSVSSRSAAAKAAFRRCEPCPATGLFTGACPGYVVDHIVALKRGGADDPDNMQWQTVEDARAKDHTE